MGTFLIVNNHDVGCVNNLSALLAARGQQYVVMDRTETLSPGAMYQGIFLSGSGDMDVSQPYATSEVRLDLQCLSGQTAPIMGICFGFEMIVSAFGGNLITLPTPIPPDPVQITLLEKPWLFAGLPDQVEMLEFNTLGADYVPPFLLVLAQSERSPIEATQHAWRPIVATQFHPEAKDQSGQQMPAGVQVVNNFISFCLGMPPG